ncbi:unnamed protein product [Cyclocybe aegerita]|uniref:F-box domain-containing protein n=1 Tax=Cyclocybe aegerita TaxID=1973307 RepID=A0A8S0WA38_CYCAE|nr:unnamed protein product [Cyclocybe aegerita]
MESGSTGHAIVYPQVSRLPPELVCIIFNFLTESHATEALRSCALVSKGFLQPIRKQLFSSITLRLVSHPRPILIHDVVRRIQGLTDLFQREPLVASYVKRFSLLDSYPVYESQWITQQRGLPPLLDTLTSLTFCEFGTAIGFLDWQLFPPALRLSLTRVFQGRQLRTLKLRNLGCIPAFVLMATSVKAMDLNNVTVPPDQQQLALPPVVDTTPFRQLAVLNVRTVSVQNTNSAWVVIQAYRPHLKVLKWRCWEDHRSGDGFSLPGNLNLTQLPKLTTLSFRLSFGVTGRDLAGLCQLLESPLWLFPNQTPISPFAPPDMVAAAASASNANPNAASPPSVLRRIDIALLFPEHRPPNEIRAIISTHSAWTRLPLALTSAHYPQLRKVRMDMSVHEWRTPVDDGSGRMQSSVVACREMMKGCLQRLANVSSLHLKWKVQAFPKNR